jgi:thiol:disulfide interchange protein
MIARASSSLTVALVAAATALTGCKADEAAPAKPVPVEVIGAPAAGDVAEAVRQERARAPGRPLLVYVGATWCEPCQRFHQAVLSGQVDALFPGLRLLEFDLDHDRDRLQQAGYTSKMIPLFALPREDGAASGKQIEGSIKGPGAVSEITPRLKALLANP